MILTDILPAGPDRAGTDKVDKAFDALIPAVAIIGGMGQGDRRS